MTRYRSGTSDGLRWISLAVIFGVLLSGCGLLGASSDLPKAAPDFTLEDLNEEEITLSQLRDKPVMLNFWASWCAPCQLEMPLMESAYQEYKDRGLVILAINTGETTERALDFATEHGLTFPIVLDQDAAISKLYRTRGLPTSYFIDSQGFIVDEYVGMLSERRLESYLDKIVE